MKYTRVLLKLSGEALMGSQGYGIDPAIVHSIAEDVAKVVASGTQLAIVVGGGNIWRGTRRIRRIRRQTTSQRPTIFNRHGCALRHKWQHRMRRIPK